MTAYERANSVVRYFLVHDIYPFAGYAPPLPAERQALEDGIALAVDAAARDERHACAGMVRESIETAPAAMREFLQVLAAQLERRRDAR